MGSQVLQQRGLQPAAVGAVRAAEGLVSSVDTHVTPQGQRAGERPVETRRAGAPQEKQPSWGALWVA